MLNVSINQAIISEILSSIRKGELGYGKQLGFDENELVVISDLNTREILDLCNSPVPFAKVQINHQAFWNLIEVARENTHQSNIIDRALELGASSEMLHNRFGWSSADVSARRRLRGIKEPMGRKRNAYEAEELKVWELWQKHKDNVKDDIETSPEGFDLLMFIAEETGVSLTEVWRLISTWIKENN